MNIRNSAPLRPKRPWPPRGLGVVHANVRKKDYRHVNPRSPPCRFIVQGLYGYDEAPFKRGPHPPGFRGEPCGDEDGVLRLMLGY
ncbi:hypothetical protein Cob_v001265 [Colletotrichum orbiculare MAFF 240422]|uniref:Uncharacterized protein n=1 Tax=Colletotrichum orbiculare (strain 104-T / ATCC 96160 / CBS 514.97 / LARS 414 / MAFF 240422) TaxID=1213857 RepID=A0A484G5T3_COLOR|nr:hypothetical protein Cob_v001265 [Colletotrichum orbiculare MAFF 240422]